MPMVLVVDDTAVDRRLAGGLLESVPNIEVCYAQNGNEALVQLGTSLPDLVVTDLQMPDLDGLELVNAIGRQYPGVPVVLMTAHGSENIAAQALASGAASFVPKSALADSLVETVMHVLMMTESEARYKRLIDSAIKTDLEFELKNDLDIIAPLMDMIHQVSLGHNLLDENSQLQLSVAVEQALNNAMVRGNLEIKREEFPFVSRQIFQDRAQQAPYSERTIYFRVLVTREAASFTVRDQGPGFDLSTVPSGGNPDSFREGSGRGLVLIKTFMDEVKFNDQGNEITMTKFKKN
jgi:CheY-like chemotaxis protein